MDKPSVDLRIGGDRFRIERDSTGEMMYFINDLAVTVSVYLARMQHYRENRLAEAPRTTALISPHPAARASFGGDESSSPGGLRSPSSR